jgi:serine/threonine-protein kinase
MTESGNGPHLIGGRYELGELLGRGGMAEVRKGTDVRLGRTVAIKRLRTDLASDATFQARFRREAQSAASLNHSAIVSVYDTGEELSTDGTNVAQPYIVMEYVAGRTLRDILREGRKILPERALEIVSGILGALDYSHRAGIIHRDIKPANVMLTPSGDVKVMDFGIARAVSDAQSTMTQTAAVVGTAQYLSPEQARGETVDSRSDVYSTGCLLFELLTGRPPFVGDSPVAVAYQHVREQAPRPSSLDADLPPAVDAIVAKSLAKRLEDRYQSAAAMKEDIDRYLAGRPVQAPPAADPVTTVVPPVPLPYDGGTSATGNWAPVDEPRRNGPLILLGLLLLALIIGAIVLIPKLIGSAPNQTSVPSVLGMTQAQAVARLERAGLTGTVGQTVASDTVPKGEVISQTPEGNTFVSPNTTVTLKMSSGKPQATIPNVIHDGRDAAVQQLAALGLTNVVVQEKFNDETSGNVYNISPAVGTQVGLTDQITLFVSKGPRNVPNVVGKTQAQATQILQAAGFQVSPIPDSASTQPKGTVTFQSPTAGTPQPSGTTVTIGLSTYTPPTSSPTDTATSTPTGGGLLNP